MRDTSVRLPVSAARDDDADFGREIDKAFQHGWRAGPFGGTVADPHLALAAVLLAARQGIEGDLPLADPVRGAPGPGAPTLPTSLAEAADLLDGSEIARKGLGYAVVNALVAAARAEWTAYSRAVSEWERARGFERR